jgi:hypothetical protein
MQQTSVPPIAAADRRNWLALYVLCVGMLMIVLDATIVNVARLGAVESGCERWRATTRRPR